MKNVFDKFNFEVKLTHINSDSNFYVSKEGDSMSVDVKDNKFSNIQLSGKVSERENNILKLMDYVEKRPELRKVILEANELMQLGTELTRESSVFNGLNDEEFFVVTKFLGGVK